MNKVLRTSLSLFFVFVFMCSYGQKQLVKKALKGSKKLFKVESKSVAKEGVESSKKSLMKDAFKTGSKEIGKNYMKEANAKQLIRGDVRKKIAKKSSINSNYSKKIAAFSKEVDENISKDFTRVRKNAAKAVHPKKTAKNATHLVALYGGKGGFKKFMTLSMKERMVTIKQITKHIFSLPKAERDKILSSMPEEMRNRVLKMRKLMTSGMPPKSGPKGRWTGEIGNSDFILDDNFIWRDPKTGIKTSVGELRKKYKIKGEVKVKYRDGEPIFDKSNSLGTTTVEYKQNYNYKDLKDLHNSVNEKLSREPWVKAKINKRAENPTRDYVENAAVDGSRVSGARNTYHEAMNGETIYIVPDFIHNICRHNGGRSVARLVQ